MRRASFDELAQSAAAGLSRRQVLAAALTGSIGIAVEESSIAAIARAATAGVTCRVCQKTGDSVACHSCRGVRDPTPSELRRLAGRDVAQKRLAESAAAQGFRRAGAQKLWYVHKPHGRLAVAEQPLVAPDGRGASLFYARIPAGNAGHVRAQSFLIITTGDVDQPTLGMAIDSGGNVITINPWDQAHASRDATHGPDQVAHPAFLGLDCAGWVHEACTVPLGKLCGYGAKVLIGSLECAAAGPEAIVLCWVIAIGVCFWLGEVSADKSGCAECMTAHICGCGAGKTKCAVPNPGLGCSVACVDTQSDSMNCGTCQRQCTLCETCQNGDCTPKYPNGCPGQCQYCDPNTGTCQPRCSPTQTCCGNVCWDPCPSGEARDPTTCVCQCAPSAAGDGSNQQCGGCFYCPCNNTTYSDVQVCISDCQVTLGCFVNICGEVPCM